MAFSLNSAFEDYGWGTRAVSLGGAYVAIADDSTGPFYNPSGIALMKRSEATFTYAGLHVGLDIESLSLMQTGVVMTPFEFGYVGANWARFNVNGLYTEDTFILTYANQLNYFNNMITPNISVGANVKLFRTKFNLYDDLSNDPVFQEGDSNTILGFDLGGMLNIERDNNLEDVRVGLSMMNINTPDIGMKDDDRIPFQMKAGIYYPFVVKGNVLQDIYVNQSAMALSITYIDRKDFTVHLGWENNFFKNLLSFRMGVNSNELGGGLGVKYGINNKVDILFHYSFFYPLKLKDTYGTHRSSLSVRF